MMALGLKVALTPPFLGKLLNQKTFYFTNLMKIMDDEELKSLENYEFSRHNGSSHTLDDIIPSTQKDGTCERPSQSVFGT